MDQDVINLAKAIRQQESGGDFNKVGDAGTSHGAYQWQPETWKMQAQDILGDANAPMTRDNQQAVAYGSILKDKQAGLNPAQIAAKWNSGHPDDWENKIGVATINGQKVPYNVPHYVKNVTEYYQQYKNSGGDYAGAGLLETPAQNQPSLTDSGIGSLPVIKQATQLGVGIGSGAGRALLNIPKAIFSASQGIANLGSKIFGAPQQDYSGITKGIDNVSSKIFQEPVQNELNSLSGKIGNVVGQTAPYIATGGAISELSNAATGAEALSGTGIIPAIGRTLAGATTEGLANASTGYALSGGDTKQALTQGATAGLLKGATGAIGEIGNATKFPQRLIQNTYKTDKNTVAHIFDETGTSNEGNTQPLSKWALDKGLKGSLQAQALKVKSILNQSENQVMASADAAKKTIPVHPGLFKMAQGLNTDFQDVGRGEISQAADKFLRAVKDNSVSVKDAIEFKRLLTNKLLSTHAVTNPSLGNNLSYWANDLMKQINNIDGIGGINKDYSMAMKAKDALIAAAKAKGNEKATGALEAYFLGGGLLAGEPISGLGVVAIKRAMQSRNVTSRIAQGLRNLPKSSAAGSATRSVIGSQLGALNQ